MSCYEFHLIQLFWKPSFWGFLPQPAMSREESFTLPTPWVIYRLNSLKNNQRISKTGRNHLMQQFEDISVQSPLCFIVLGFFSVFQD